MLAWRSAVMAGQVSRQMRKWWEAGGLSCLVSSSISPALPCCVCGCLWCCPNQASQRWHTAYCTAALHGPQSASIPAPVSLCRRAAKRNHIILENLTHFMGQMLWYWCFFYSYTLHLKSSVPLVHPVISPSLSLYPTSVQTVRVWDRHSLQVNMQTQSFQACCSERWNEHWSLQRERERRVEEKGGWTSISFMWGFLLNFIKQHLGGYSEGKRRG